MSLFGRPPWRRQPPTPTGADRANEITGGLKYLFAGLGGGTRDIASRVLVTPTGNPAIGVKDGEQFTAFDGTDDYYDIASVAATIGAMTGPVSLLFRFYGGADAAKLLFQVDDGTNSNTFSVFIGDGVTGLLTNELITISRQVTATGGTPLLGYTTATRTEVFDSKVHTILLTSDGATWSCFLDGVSKTLTVGAGSNNGLISVAGANNAKIGNRTTSPLYFDGGLNLFGLWTRNMSAYAVALHKNPWQLFQPIQRQIFTGFSGAGSTGTLATTNANDISAASGTTTVLGTLAKTNANDTSAASGTTTVTGTLAKTNANDTCAASGSVGSGSTGTVAYTNANDTSAAAGTTTVVGTLARANANDTAAAAGWAGTISGTLAYTNANDTATASGTTDSGLIGRKYPRGRSRRRKTDDIEITPKVVKKIIEEKGELIEELAEAQAELISTGLMVHNTVNRAEKIKALSSQISTLEDNLARVREEEVLIMLAFMVLE